MKQGKLPPGNNHGFTLVETIVASLLMVIGSLVLSTGFVAAARMLTVSTGDRQNALAVASVMNGGMREGTADTGKAVTITFSIDGIPFAYKGVMEEYSNIEDESIAFYRIG